MSGFPYEIMRERQDALERLDLRIFWGNYEIRILRFHLTTFLPGKIVSFHKHSEFEFHFIPRGKGMVILGDETFALRDGMFYLTGPGVMHYQEADARIAMDELCLHIDIIDRSEPADAAQGERVLCMDPWEIAEAQDCMDKLRKLPLKPTMDVYQAMPCFLEAYQAAGQKYLGLYATIKQCIIQILLRSLRAYDTENITSELPARDMKLFRYRLAKEFIRANSSGEITLEDVAEKLHISARQLQRIFKELNDGRSFSGILEDARLEAVCRRLVETKLAIEKIAVMEGFSNGSYLHTVFRKRYGVTPSAYRKINSNT